MAETIPIRNIYYLLLYAWDYPFREELVSVSDPPETRLVNLFAKVLAKGTRHVLRRGLERDYEEVQDETHYLRGRLAMDECIKRALLPQARVVCRYSEFTPNTLHNRILKATLVSLLRSDLDDKIQSEVSSVLKWLGDVKKMALTPEAFRQVRIHRNNIFYSFLMNVCAVVYRKRLADEKDGVRPFSEFERDRRWLARLFEKFVRGFLRREQDEYYVGRDGLDWAVASLEDPERSYFPSMMTDVTLRARDGSRTIVIDAKFTPKALFQYRNRRRIRSSHLYQMYAYLKNVEHRGGSDQHAEGILLYPRVNEDLNLSYDISDADGASHRISIRTLDLSQEWQQIHDDLLRLTVHDARESIVEEIPVS